MNKYIIHMASVVMSVVVVDHSRSRFFTVLLSFVDSILHTAILCCTKIASNFQAEKEGGERERENPLHSGRANVIVNADRF